MADKDKYSKENTALPENIYINIAPTMSALRVDVYERLDSHHNDVQHVKIKGFFFLKQYKSSSEGVEPVLEEIVKKVNEIVKK
jgi:hypothetical protein